MKKITVSQILALAALTALLSAALITHAQGAKGLALMDSVSPEKTIDSDYPNGICVLPDQAQPRETEALTIKPTPEGGFTGSIVSVGMWKSFPVRPIGILASVPVQRSESKGIVAYIGENFSVILPTDSLDGSFKADLGGHSIDSVIMVNRIHYKIWPVDRCESL